MIAKVSDIIKIIDEIAPPSLAEEWDNIGLQVGQHDWDVKHIWIALDPSTKIISAACKHKVDLLITHHPLIFKPLTSVDFNTPAGAAIKNAALNRLAVFAAHTNLDSVKDGLNDALANKIDLKNIRMFNRSRHQDKCKLVVYVPVDYEQKIISALADTNAGVIGDYTACSFSNRGTGMFRPGANSKPFSGTKGRISTARETRIETVVHKNDIQGVVAHIRRYHPYETMAYDVYPLYTDDAENGLGRIGELDRTMTISSFARTVKNKLKLKAMRFAGKPGLKVKKVAVCSGSGSGLLHQFIASGADVYLSGDFKYHDAKIVEEAGLGLIDIGHYASERLVVNTLAGRLKKILAKTPYNIKVTSCKLEKDPFVVL